MTKEELEGYRQIIYDQCEKIRVGVPHGNKYSDYTEEDTKVVLTISETDLKHSAKTIQEFMQEHDGSGITIEHSLRAAGRHDYLKEIRVVAKTYKLRDEVSDYTVKRYMQKIVAKQLGLYYWQTPECKILKLFKEGTITWEEVVKAHKDTCDL